MRITLLTLSLLVSGCVDATGIFSDCSARQAAVRAQYGAPDASSPVERSRGDFLQTYEYYEAGRFIFRWGDSYDGCQVERTPINVLIPEREAPLIPSRH